MTICPLLLTVAEKFCWVARNLPPAVARMSKFVSTRVPLMLTLKRLWPAAVQKNSAK
jgi:hypothetical protein